MNESDPILEVLESLEELHSDSTLPKNVKLKIEKIISTLNDTNETSIKVNKALDDFDEIVSDINLEPHTRTQIWGVVSALETCNSDSN
tara:strand:+ start:20041 stop:20304 length:264 start_codon:yes stop_codon:yes gene_type:complete